MNEENIKQKEEIIEIDQDKRFQTEFPDAKVINKFWFDITNDGVDEFIVFYYTDKLKANFAILTEEQFNTVSLNDENSNFIFADGNNSIKKLEKPNRMLLTLKDNNKNKIFDLEISVEYNKKNNKMDIIIKSIDK